MLEPADKREIRFPAFLVGAETPSGCYAVVLVDDGKWLPLFESEESAQLYLERVDADADCMPLAVDREALRISMLAHPDIRGCMFNPHLDSPWIEYIERHNFL
ncbi:MAG TPA: hypothetical protein VGG64_04030 [Pirellulales bacterium]